MLTRTDIRRLRPGAVAYPIIDLHDSAGDPAGSEFNRKRQSDRTGARYHNIVIGLSARHHSPFPPSFCFLSRVPLSANQATTPLNGLALVRDVAMPAPVGQIISRVLLSWRTSPLTKQRTVGAWGSGTSSLVTIHGPIGPCVSNDLPIVNVGEWNCQSRAETSFATKYPNTCDLAWSAVTPL